MAARNLFGSNTTLAPLSASDPTSRTIVVDGGRLDMTPEDLVAGSIDALAYRRMTAIRTSCQMDATEGLSAVIGCAPTVFRELTDETLDSLRFDLPAQGWADHRLGDIGMAVEICESDAPVRSRTVKTLDMATGPSSFLPATMPGRGRPGTAFAGNTGTFPRTGASACGRPAARSSRRRDPGGLPAARPGPDQMIRTWVPTGVMA